MVAGLEKLRLNHRVKIEVMIFSISYLPIDYSELHLQIDSKILKFAKTMACTAIFTPFIQKTI